MTGIASRRSAFAALGAAAAAFGLSRAARAANATPLEPAGAHRLAELTDALARLPVRRDFTSVPMILTSRDQFDAAALDMILGYRGGPKQAWDNVELHGPTLTLMHNSMNVQVFSFAHPEFLCVAATRGPALLALYDDAMWEKYQLGKMAGGDMTRNTLLRPPPGLSMDTTDLSATGPFGNGGSSIVTLQQRGAVFMACHTALWAQAAHLAETVNPDKLGPDAIAAELSNHLVPGAVLIPGAVATLVELQAAGFAFAK
jgi:intracellular sulfur oxidation DsrE/DsrF family protein